MNVTIQKTKSIEVEYVKFGQCFMYSDAVYMKTDVRAREDFLNCFVCVNITNGENKAFSKTVVVRPIEADVNCYFKG